MPEALGLGVGLDQRALLGGAAGELEVVLGGPGRLLVVVDVQTLDGGGGVVVRVALELQLVDQSAAGEGGEVQVRSP